MKRNKLLTTVGLLVLSMVASGCSCSQTVNASEKTIGVYSFIDKESGSSLSDLKQKDIYARVIFNEEYVPYLDFATYISFFYPHFYSDYRYNIDEDRGNISFTISNIKEEPIYTTSINVGRETFITAGSPSSALKTTSDISKTSLAAISKFDAAIAERPTKNYVQSFASTGYKPFVMGSKAYFPLSLLEAVYANDFSIHHIYNFERIIQFTDQKELNEFEYNIDGKTYTTNSEMKNFIKNHLDNKMPKEAKEDRRSAFLFIMENQYGLKSTRKIESMIALYRNQTWYPNFLNDDHNVRSEALQYALCGLDDAHTGLSREKTAYGETAPANYPVGGHIEKMVTVKQSLTPLKEAFYKAHDTEIGDVIYLNEGKVAFMTFDGFTVMRDAYDEDGNLKEEVYKEDTFFWLKKNLENLNEGVEKVVLDISTNGGGVLGILLNILALISKNNVGYLYLHDDRNNATTKQISSVDTNRDNKYNSDDSYGRKYDFYILSSLYSFSCGNALPFAAQKAGIATIIGQKSGGGECVVGESYLPSGEYFNHSSMSHIGWYNGLSFEGDEDGCTVNKLIDYEDFFKEETYINL